MKQSRFSSFLLLSVFLVFTICHCYSNVRADQTDKTVKLVISDEKEEPYQLKSDDNKKSPIIATQAIDLTYSLISIFFIIFLFAFLCLSVFFLIPVFFQSNYVINAPLFLQTK
ncbi:hypothetical protein [Bacillus sp. T3]|uniref:hypothetical protein n=1 Tax=Bacillus sp. T3 TaxID=467262 RepID=UPI002982A8E4|nr:hypothetical protein [Bacillus sp. T3]